MKKTCKLAVVANRSSDLGGLGSTEASSLSLLVNDVQLQDLLVWSGRRIRGPEVLVPKERGRKALSNRKSASAFHGRRRGSRRDWQLFGRFRLAKRIRNRLCAGKFLGPCIRPKLS